MAGVRGLGLSSFVLMLFDFRDVDCDLRMRSGMGWLISAATACRRCDEWWVRILSFVRATA